MDAHAWLIHGLVVVLTLALVLASVVGHYEGLNWLSRRLARREGRRRPRVLYAVFGSLGLHVGQIGLFGLAIWVLLQLPGAGAVVGMGEAMLLDSLYLSAETFSTVGFGDVAPAGPIRFLIAAESVIGLMLIAWSATFTFFEMERNWREH